MNIDFHFHSNCSDGALPPRAVIARAAYHGAQMVALTDHDQIAGIAEARSAADELGIELVNGVEISVTWGQLTIHVVGLGFDVNNPTLIAGLADMANSRAARAQKMGDRLAEAGISDAFKGALAQANGRLDLLSRTHFARDLVARKKAVNVRAVFQDFLVAGKPGYIEHQWAGLAQAVGWITQAGGVAVLAHPGRYQHASLADELVLIEAFMAAGGRGIEVVTGSHGKGQYKKYGQMALDFGLYASRGSDFHAKGESKMDVGKVPQLAQGLIGVEVLLS